ncbi:MAG: phosphotransferase [Candidatus Nanopelagicales bacterium]
MHKDAVAAGLRNIFGAEPEIDLPDDSGQPWLTVKYGDDPDDLYGVLRAQVGGRNVIVKVNPTRGVGQTLIPWIIAERGIRLPRPYASFEAAAETSDTARREIAVYGLPAVQDVVAHRLGAFDADGQTALVLEDLGEIAYLDASGSIERWPTGRIEQALEAAAGFHAATAGHDYGWTIQRPSTTTMLADVPLWDAILADAAERFPDIVTTEVVAARRETLDTLARWHPAKDVMPACLVQNDFNQRNVGFRDTGEVVVLDWELARVNTPQRDVAELLTFTLDAHTEVDELLHLLAVHWQALADNGMDIDPGVYARAAAAEFRVQSLDRVGMQLIFGAAFDLPYLTRINRTVDHLVALTKE